MNNKHFSRVVSIFHGIPAPEKGTLAGYTAIIEAYDLRVPIPYLLTLISPKQRQYTDGPWQVMTARHAPANSLYKQLAFALRYEGINLLVFKKLFENLDRKEVEELVHIAPVGQYSRKIWFLYEWLTDDKLDIADLNQGNYVPLVRDDLQFAIEGVRSSRHRIVNNLPGTPAFCPLIFKTEKLGKYLAADLAETSRKQLTSVHKDILLRTSAFLLLKDSKASFTIEGESPKNKRAARWANAIGQAGARPLTAVELLRLQQIVIESDRFTKMGFRTDGGFVGEHDRSTGEPIPEHISARWQDIGRLIDGLIATNELLLAQPFDAVLAAAVVSFGFVFIHPFTDGNGRIHRYMIHHILSKKKFSQPGFIFPVSASMLERIDEYRSVLESYSHPLLDLIEWQTTSDRNIEVLNETIDYYRYFDATRQAEFLYDCVRDTIERIIPDELQYLMHYDAFKHFIEDEYEMPDKTVSLLVHFLEQNGGSLPKRARSKEFAELRDDEVELIETKYQEIFSLK